MNWKIIIGFEINYDQIFIIDRISEQVYSNSN